MNRYNLIKKIYTKNNNEIILVENISFNVVGVETPTYLDETFGQKLPSQKTILIIGVVHGEEPQGKVLIENFLNYPPPQPSPSRGEGAMFQFETLLLSKVEFQAMGLPPRPLRERVRVRGKNRLLFIPCLNPDGLAQNKRQNANGVDLNRNFPTLNWGKTDKNSEYYGGENSASEIETKFLIEILAEFSPDVILTIHAPYKVVNYDGPAEEIAQKISEIIGYPVSKDIGYPTPGSFGTYAGVERNIPTITLELDEEAAINDLQEPFNQICDYLANS